MKSIPFLFLPAACLTFLLHAEPGPESDKDFTHSVTTQKKPWTKREFRNDPNDFQFVIVTDRTGGLRPGVFSRAVDKVNELQPEFVISVGDLIPGGRSQRDEKELYRQWNEFNGLAEKFEMPFFYLPGNHDVSNNVADKIWDEQFGVRYYSFVYKKVLFLCLNTQDGNGSLPFLGDNQITWAQAELKKHPDARWTMVFIHQPLWLTEESGRKPAEPRKSLTGWPEIETALSGRKHTVYAGHVHRYAKYSRNDVNYFTLGTTGGGSRLRGDSFGEFDHATWITMTDDGPRMMNLTLDGMLDKAVSTEAHQKFWRGLKFTDSFGETFPFKNQVVTLPLENTFDTPVSGRMSWLLPSSDYWTVSPRRLTVDLEPGEKKDIEFTLNHKGDVSTFFPLPRLETQFYGEESGLQLDMALYLPLDFMEHAKKHPVKTRVSATSDSPTIDGRLDDPLWKSAPTISRLIPRKADGHATVNTKVWLSYDDTFLYVGIRCHEPLMRDVISDVTDRDGEVWTDDSVELLLDTNGDTKSYHHFAVNSKGLLFDGERDNPDWTTTAEIVTTIEGNAWFVEMAIPLEEVGANLSKQTTWGMQIVRNRPRLEERKSYQWAPTFWYGNYLPSLFGQVEFD